VDGKGFCSFWSQANDLQSGFSAQPIWMQEFVSDLMNGSEAGGHDK
jgi:hypothetical protein